MNFDRTDLAWASGLFEGEGNIGEHSYKSGLVYPQVTLSSTDEDVVRFFHDVLGGIGTVTFRPPKEGELRNKDMWTWSANSFENSQAVIAMFWPYLKQRRRARAIKAFNLVRDSQVHRKTMRRGSECSEEGCTDPVLARGFCRSHYTKSKYKERNNECVMEGCTRRPNGSRGECRAHTNDRRKKEKAG